MLTTLILQVATIAAFASTATDPNTAMPVAAPATYSTPQCGQPRTPQPPPPIVNPTIGAWDEGTSTQCQVNVAPQMRALPDGTYLAAVKLGPDPYGPFSVAFTVAAQAAHPCDGAAPTTGSVVAGNRTLGWCFQDGADGGSPITGWAIYVDGVRSLAGTVTAGTTANAAGQRLYSTPLTVSTGTRVIRVAAVNAVNEGSASATYTLTVQAPATAPTGTPGVRGVN